MCYISVLVCQRQISQLGWIEQKKLIFFSQFWSLEVQVKAMAGLVLSEVAKDVLVHNSHLASGDLQAIFGVPRLAEASLCSAFISSCTSHVHVHSKGSFS